MKAVTGIDSGAVAEWISCQVIGLMSPGEKLDAKDVLKRIAFATDTLGELRPENATQAMLATQMIGVHGAAIQFLLRAFSEGQTVEGPESNVNRATRLMRLFNEQLEAMQKLKEMCGQQKVVVEHVQVHQGGQAIVGAVSGGGGGGANLKSEQEPQDHRDFSTAARCEAKTRRNTKCRCPAMKNGRCRLHGGLSTGPKTAAGTLSGHPKTGQRIEGVRDASFYSLTRR